MRLAYVCADPGIPVFGAKGASIHVQEVSVLFGGRGFRCGFLPCAWAGSRPRI